MQALVFSNGQVTPTVPWMQWDIHPTTPNLHTPEHLRIIYTVQTGQAAGRAMPAVKAQGGRENQGALTARGLSQNGHG